jgi:hypothetical protein
VSFIILTSYSSIAFAQIDSEAVAILDRMSNVITNLESCSFTLKTEYDIYNERLGLVKYSDVASVFLKAPDKLLVNKKGDKGQKNFYYDGNTFSYYSVDNNQFASIPVTLSIMEIIDSLHNEYGIDFPAADIFYPDLVDYLITNSDNLSYLGLTNVDDKECFQIAGTSDEITYQLWITNDESYLPLKMSIVYTNRTANPQYEALFQNWSLNPSLDDSMFNFIVPEGAIKIKLLKNN